MTAGVLDRTLSTFEQYLVSCGKLPKTVKTYKGNLRVFWRWCESREITPYEASPALLREFFAERERTGISATRRKNDLHALNHFYGWLLETKYLNASPLPSTLKVRGEVRETTRPFTAEEMECLVAACERPRDRLIVLMFATTGIRIGELVAQCIEDIDWRAGQILIHGKGSKERFVRPPSAFLEELRAFVGLVDSDGQAVRTGPLWLSLRRGQDGVFKPLSEQTIRDKLLKPIGVRAGVPGVKPHRFRAAFATEFQDENHDIEALQSVMGHESMDTTTRYSGSVKHRRGMEIMANLRVSARLLRVNVSPSRPSLPRRLFGLLRQRTA